MPGRADAAWLWLAVISRGKSFRLGMLLCLDSQDSIFQSALWMHMAVVWVISFSFRWSMAGPRDLDH